MCLADVSEARNTSTAPELLSLQDLAYRYKRAKSNALQGLTASFSTGKIAVLGPNGAGKTTLFDILSRGLSPTSGNFTFAERTATGPRGPSDTGHRLGFMPQSLRIFGGYSAREFLIYCSWLKDTPSQAVDEQVNSSLRTVRLWDHRDTKVRKLSGGMRQRLGLAQALLGDPLLLLLDEPTVGLDPQQRHTFRDVLRDLSPSTTLVLATHLVEDVASIASELLVLDQGKAVFAGPVTNFCGLPPDAVVSGREIEAAYLRVVSSE